MTGEYGGKVQVRDKEGNFFTVHRDTLKDLRIEYMIVGESHPVPQYEEDKQEERNMVSRETEMELKKLRAQVEELQRKKGQTPKAPSYRRGSFKAEELPEYIMDFKDGVIATARDPDYKEAEFESEPCVIVDKRLRVVQGYHGSRV